MNHFTVFVRSVFTCLSVLLFATFTTTTLPLFDSIFFNILLGGMIGIGFALLLFTSDIFFQGLSLKKLNSTALGLIFGYFIGQALFLALTGVFEAATLVLKPEVLSLIKGTIFLLCLYFGVLFTARASDEILISIPFVKFKPSSQKKRDLVLDFSVLSDTRLIDLAASGLFENRLVLPRFILKEIYDMNESQNEGIRFKARRCLDVVKKLEEMPDLNMKNNDRDFPEIKESQNKLIRLARLLDAHILSSEIHQIENSLSEGVKIINLNTLSKALKPVTQNGEWIQIKVQRYGKEARQGVGYLDDGTMVVINGGAEFIGETIKAQVLSVKHTSSGRMIFCNAVDEENGTLFQEDPFDSIDSESSAKKYFAL